jgi:predicted dehydrogenase
MNASTDPLSEAISELPPEPPRMIRCGVAGVGSLGQHHARIYHAMEHAELVGIFEMNDARAEEICARFQCKRFGSIEELGQACEAVSVVVPTDHHRNVAIPLLRQGCNLIIEKPLCFNRHEAEEILQAAKQSGVICQVGHIEHFNPVTQFLEDHIYYPRYIVADRFAPFQPRGTEVGVVLDLMIHDLGIIRQLVKSPIKKVDALGVNVLSQTEDIANARITFENGCVANINTSRVSLNKKREIRVFQPNAYLSLNFMEQTGHLLTRSKGKIERHEIPIEKAEPLMLELKSFLQCIRDRAAPKVDVEFGKSTLELALDITEMIQEQLKAEIPFPQFEQGAEEA